jgi:transposase
VRFSKWMLAEIGRLFALWHAFQGSDMETQTLIQKSVPLRSRMSRCLQLHCTNSDFDVAKMAKSLLKHWHGLLTFLEYRGIDPTNNAAERALRPAVQWRKICFGNQSAEGDLLTARLLTAERSCIRQGRNAFRFLVDSVNAYRSNLPGPSLLMPSC